MKEFEIKSGLIHVTDPCYNVDTWCGNYNLKAKKGKWVAKVVEKDEGNFGIRVHQLIAKHEDISSLYGWEELPNEIGVDSGQAGVFDASKYDPKSDYDDENGFYHKVCHSHDESEPGVIETGCVSSSGYGDGGYVGECVRIKDEIVAVRITFIGDEQ